MAGVKISALPPDSSIGGAELVPLMDSTTTKAATTAALAAYVVDTLIAAASATPATGDVILGYRSTTEKSFTLDTVSAYAVASAWSAASTANPVVSGDLALIQRSGTVYKVNVDVLTTYVLTGIQATVLNISGLSAATLGGTDQLLVCQSTTAMKTTLADLETKLWADYLTYTNALTVVTAPTDGDKLYIIQGGVAKHVTPALLATYVATEKATDILAVGWDAAAVTPAASGDILLIERSGVLKTMDVDGVVAYVSSTFDASAEISSVLATDTFLCYRSNVRKVVTAANLADYVHELTWPVDAAAGFELTDNLLLQRAGASKTGTVTLLASAIQSTILNISALSSATLDGTDILLAVEGTTAKKATLTELETKLFADTVTHVSGLSAVTVVAGTDVFHTIQGGTEKNVTPVELATYMLSVIASDLLDSAWGAAAVSPLVTGDVFLVYRDPDRKTAEIDDIVTYNSAALAASAAITPSAASDKILTFRSSEAKLTDIDVLASYIVTSAWGATVITSLNDADEFLVGQSAVSKNITATNLKTYVLTGIQATVLDISGLNTGTPGGTDLMLLCQSGVGTKATLASVEALIHADLATYVAALTDATTLVDADKFYILNSGNPKYATATEIATYVTAEIWAGAAATDPVLSGDSFLMYRGGTGTLQATVNVIEDYLATGLTASILDLSTLSEATLASADLMLVCQTTTPKYTTIADLAAEVHDEFTAYVEALDPVVTVADADYIYCSQAGTAKYTTPLLLAGYCWTEITSYIQALSAKTAPVDDDKLMLQDSAASDALKELTLADLWNNLYAAKASSLPWKSIASAKYTTTPANTSTITMSDTSDMAVGLPLKYTYNGTTYYGIVTAVTANTSVTIAGAPLNVTYPLTALYVGGASNVCTLTFAITGVYDDAIQDVLAEVEEQYFKWQGAAAYLVAFSATNHWVDSGATQPKINVKINGNLVSTNDSNNGLQTSAVAGTWVDNSAVAISTTNYAIARGNAIEIRCTASGTNGDAECLTVLCVFVYQ